MVLYHTQLLITRLFSYFFQIFSNFDILHNFRKWKPLQFDKMDSGNTIRQHNQKLPPDIREFCCDPNKIRSPVLQQRSVPTELNFKNTKSF